MMTQLIRSKTVAEAKEITEKEILTAVEGLPGDESHCAELAVKTLHKTLRKYEKTIKSQ
jgi:nitrogen fixation NifU-like protein